MYQLAERITDFYKGLDPYGYRDAGGDDERENMVRETAAALTDHDADTLRIIMTDLKDVMDDGPKELASEAAYLYNTLNAFI